MWKGRIGGGERWLAVCGSSLSDGIVLWDWSREKVLRLSFFPPGEEQEEEGKVETPSRIAIHTVREVDSDQIALVAIQEHREEAFVWDLSERTFQQGIRPHAQRIKLDTSKQTSTQDEQEREHTWRNLCLRLKLCGLVDVIDKEILRLPNLSLSESEDGELNDFETQVEGELVDVCRVSQWFTVGMTKDAVHWLRDGRAMLEFSDWFEPVRKTDTTGQEELVAVAANSVSVCVASDFGNLYVLDKKTFQRKQTIPLGVLAECLTFPCVKQNLLAVATHEGQVFLLDLVSLSIIDYIEEEQGQEREKAKPSSGVCECCGKEAKVEGSTVISNSLFVACRDAASGKTMVKSRRQGSKCTLVEESKGPATLRFVADCLVTCTEDECEIAVFRVGAEACAKVSSYRLQEACVCFDVDLEKRNRIIAGDTKGTVYVFKFSSRNTVPLQVIHFQGTVPQLLAVRGGKLAVANGKELTVLIDHGKSAENRVEKTLQVAIHSMCWNGPRTLVVNGNLDVDIQV